MPTGAAGAPGLRGRDHALRARDREAERPSGPRRGRGAHPAPGRPAGLDRARRGRRAGVRERSRLARVLARRARPGCSAAEPGPTAATRSCARGRRCRRRHGARSRPTTVARLLEAVGWDVARVAGPVDALAEIRGRVRPARLVPVFVVRRAHAADDRRAARRAKDAAARSGARPGHVTVVAVGPLAIRRRGRPVAGTTRSPAPRHARGPLRARRGAARRRRRRSTSSGWRSTGSTTRSSAVRHALTRIARLGAADESGRRRASTRSARTIARVSARSAGESTCSRPPPRGSSPTRSRRHARALAAAFHRHYNRGAFDASDVTLAGARRALACGVGRGLEGALRLLDAAERG